MGVRKRFTISVEELRAVEEYARLDNRTFSELVCEALQQMMHRYPRPRKRKNDPTANEKALIDRLEALEQIIAQKYLQVPLGANSRHMRESGKEIRR